MTPYEAGYATLVKAAFSLFEDKPTTSDYAIAAAETGLAASLLPEAYRNTVGIQRVYHGTPTDAGRDAILREGIQPTNGNVHVSPQRSMAAPYARHTDKELGQLMGDKQRHNWRMMPNDRVMAVDMPYTHYAQRFAENPDYMDAAKPTWFDHLVYEDMDPEDPAHYVKRRVAAMSEDAIPSRWVSGGKGRQFGSVTSEALGNIGNYLRRHPGRAASGGILAALSGGIGLDAARRAGLVEKNETPLSDWF